MPSCRPTLASAALVLLGALTPCTAFAVDGVIEISQACALNTGCVTGDAPGYPVTLNAPGSYRLTSNLSQSYIGGISTTVNAIQITSSDVHLDLGGFSISCTAPLGGSCGGSASGIVYAGLGLEGAVIEHGAIVGMPGSGIALELVGDVRLDDLRLGGNGADGASLGNGAMVSNVTASENGGNGIEVGAIARVADCISRDNGGDGIQSLSGTIISGCTVTQNTGDGIETSTASLVEGCSSFGNTGWGLKLALSSGYRGNVIYGNGMGTVISGIQLGGNACELAASCP